MRTYLIAVEDDNGMWIGDPETVEGAKQDAKAVADRKASGTDADLHIVTYELSEIATRRGEQD